MNSLSSAKEFALSPFSFGKILRAIGLRRRPPDCKTDRKQGKKLYKKAYKKPFRVLKHRRAEEDGIAFLYGDILLCCRQK